MKATGPCYNFLYNHASPRLRARIDSREQQVQKAEQEASVAADNNNISSADKVRHAVRRTVVTRRLVDLFFRNMSENDAPAEESSKQ